MEEEAGTFGRPLARASRTKTVLDERAQWEGIPNALPPNSVKRESLFVKRKTRLFIACTING
jgi:hypothetical protein